MCHRMPILVCMFFYTPIVISYNICAIGVQKFRIRMALNFDFLMRIEVQKYQD